MMKATKTILALVIIVFSVTSGFTIVWIANAQPADESKEESFEGESPYTFRLEGLISESGEEISNWDVTVVAQIQSIGSFDPLLPGGVGKNVAGKNVSMPGDIIEIVLYDLTDDKKAEYIIGQGAKAVATLVELDLELDHEYEVRITTIPEGRLLAGTIKNEWIETKKSSGIPGFGTESIILGLLSGTITLWVLKKNQ
jgi:hypothetical protein